MSESMILELFGGNGLGHKNSGRTNCLAAIALYFLNYW